MAFTTRISLLEKLRIGDDPSWEEFYVLYRPIVFAYGHRFGMNSLEKEELLQQVMVNFFKVSDEFHYDPAAGKFRNYFRQIVKNTATAIWKRKNRGRKTPCLPDCSNEFEAMEQEAWHGLLLHLALLELKKRVEPQTFEAFYHYGLQHRNVNEVADYLCMTPGYIYTAKSRCAGILRSIISDIRKNTPEFRL